jgi:hypothetical protein
MNTNHEILLRASKKMLKDKLDIEYNDIDILPILNDIILNFKNTNDLKIDNKDILKLIYLQFINIKEDTLENAVNILDLTRVQPVIQVPSGNQGLSTISDIKTISNVQPITNNIQITIPPKNKIYYNTLVINSIFRDINIYNQFSFFEFKLPLNIYIYPYKIIFNDISSLTENLIYLKITDRNGTLYNYHFWKNNTFYETIDNLKPISTLNLNLYTLGLYNEFDQSLKNIKDSVKEIIKIKKISETLKKFYYEILFELDILIIENFSVKDQFMKSYLFIYSYDNIFYCNEENILDIDINVILLSKQFSLICKIIK